MEARIFLQRLQFVSLRGGAVRHGSFRYMRAEITADGRKGFKNIIPSDEAQQSFRSIYPDLTFRAQENKEKTKLHDEIVEQVQHL